MAMALPIDAVLTVARMQAAEQAMIDAGTDVDELMRRAGQGAAEWVWRLAAGRSVTVLCGPGNNGGDGYVIAEALRARGLAVALVTALDPATDAARNARSQWRGEVLDAGSLPRGHVFVDCLFGSGLKRPLSDELAALVARLAASHHHSVAIDLPSNVESDSGQCLGPVPAYDLTLALGAWKWAHWTMPASRLMGARRLVEIGVAATPEAALLRKPCLAPPAPDAHKYMRGLVGVIAGRMPGASVLAVRAAQHGGAGYVKLFGTDFPPGLPHSIVVEDAPLDEALADERIGAVLVGPGLGRGDAARARLGSVLRRGLPGVLDADALTLLDPRDIEGRSNLVLTPHDGELARLAERFGIANRITGKFEQALYIAAATGAVVAAKGPDTRVIAADGRVAVAVPAPSWLATAGTGDVLAGIAVSRLATGVEPFVAACEAVWLHGEAARLAGPAFSADELAGKVAAAYAAAL